MAGNRAARARSLARSLERVAQPVVEAWWRGEPPPIGTTSSLIVIDPLASGRQRVLIGLDDAMTAPPRHRGYADAAASLLNNAA